MWFFACTSGPEEGSTDDTSAVHDTGPIGGTESSGVEETGTIDTVIESTGAVAHTGGIETGETGALRHTGGGLSVLLVHGSVASMVDDVDAELQAAGVTSVERVDASRVTPTAADLAPYDAVLVWADASWRDPAALGDALAAYADGGGGVVVATYALAEESQPGGRFLPYLPILPASDVPTPASLIAVAPTSPLLAGVSALDTAGARIGGATVAVDAQPVAVWSDGAALVAEWSVDGVATVVGVNVFPASNNSFSLGWTGDGGPLLANALQFAADGAGTPVPRRLRGWSHGACGGLVWIRGGMGTPLVAHELWIGSAGGATPAPSGACPGASLPLVTPEYLAAPVADAAGNAVWPSVLSVSTCGRQAVVVAANTCAVSDAFQLP